MSERWCRICRRALRPTNRGRWEHETPSSHLPAPVRRENLDVPPQQARVGGKRHSGPAALTVLGDGWPKRAGC